MLELGKLPGPDSGYATCTTSVTAILLLQMLSYYPFLNDILILSLYLKWISCTPVNTQRTWMKLISAESFMKKLDKFEDINTKHSWILRMKKCKFFLKRYIHHVVFHILAQPPYNPQQGMVIAPPPPSQMDGSMISPMDGPATIVSPMIEQPTQARMVNHVQQTPPTDPGPGQQVELQDITLNTDEDYCKWPVTVLVQLTNRQCNVSIWLPLLKVTNNLFSWLIDKAVEH